MTILVALAVGLLPVFLLLAGLVVIYVWQSRVPGQAVMLGSVFMIYQYAQQTAGVVSSMASNFQSFARMHTAAISCGAAGGMAARDRAKSRSRTVSSRTAPSARLRSLRRVLQTNASTSNTGAGLTSEEGVGIMRGF